MFIKMETINGYKVRYEKKVDHLFVRMDDTMIKKLHEIRQRTGITVSEIIREAVRRLLLEAETAGSINLKL
jgi:metal-responsive CopG/Arc/MetJ family transcriptional regulator